MSTIPTPDPLPPSSTTTPPPPQQQPHTKTPTLPTHTILPPTASNITRTIQTITSAFHSTPLFLTFVSQLDNLAATTARTTITASRRTEYYTPGITTLATSGAILVESGGFSAVAIWEPPEFGAGGRDFSSARRTWVPASREWTRGVKRARARYLGVPGGNVAEGEIDEMTVLKLRPFWHLGFLARDPDVRRVEGAVSAVVVPFLEKARREGVPVWLEATTRSGVGLYEHFGFRLVETIRVGVGEYGEDGWFEEGGKGCCGFCMIYDGHLDGKESEALR